MRRSHFTDVQKISALKRLESGERAVDLSRELGINQNTLYNWRSKYGGMELSELSRLKELESENRNLKRLVADLSLDNQMLKSVNSRKF